MKHRPVISGIKLSALFDILAEHDIDKNRFLNSLDLEASLFESHNRKLTIPQVRQILGKAIFLTGNEGLGLQIGLRARFLPNVVCYIMMNCLTIGDALKKYGQYKRIFNDETNVQIDVDAGHARLEIGSSASELHDFRPFNDYKLTTMFIFLKFLTKGKFKLAEVTLVHDKPAYFSAYKDVFSCPVSFSRSVNSLVFNEQLLALPVYCPNPELLKHLEKYAGKILDQISKEDGLAKKVSQVLIRRLQSGDSPSVLLMANQFNMSVRKFQGLLKQEKTSYKQLLQTVKKQLAFSYLDDRQISLSEVSYLLDFSEPSAFYRAFKKWTGHTPGQFRRTN